MPSDNGSQEPRGRSGSLAELKELLRRQLAQDAAGGHAPDLTSEEEERIAEGEPYCFRCGKPAGSFEEYDDFEESEREVRGSRADYVKREEGTYNPDTNRFACDGCYIAIGLPSGPGGWIAP